MSRTRALWLRSVWHRKAVAVGLFLIVAAATSAAVVGPLLVRAATQSGLRSDLSRAAPGEYDIVVSASGDSGGVGSPEDAVTGSALAAGTRLFNSPFVALRSSGLHAWSVPVRGAATRLSRESEVAVLSDGCARLVLVSGRCPSRRTEVLLPSSRGVTSPSIMGSSVDFSDVQVGGYLVSGVYDSRNPALQLLIDKGGAPVIMIGGGLDLLGVSTTQLARVALRASRVGLDDLTAAEQAVKQVRQIAVLQGVPTSVESTLPLLVARTRGQQRVATILALLTVMPTVLLSWYALALTMQLIASVRAAEWALGRLRGLPLRSWMRSLYAEPVALLMAGTVAGVVVGALAATLIVDTTMADGVGLELWRAPVLVSVAGTVLGAALGIAVATAGGLRLPLAALLHESAEPTRTSRTGVAAQVLLVAITALSALQLVTQAQVSIGAQNLGLLLPGLLAMVVALSVIRVGTRLVRRRAASPPRTLASLVLTRRLARNPSLLWRHSVIAVAAALIVFAVQVTVVMNRNVALRAANQVGAEGVLTVRTVSTTKLLAAVAAADPSGRYAMAAEELRGAGTGGTTRVVAVDSSRLAAVSLWQAGWAGRSPTDIARLLAPAHRPSIVLRGTTVTLTVRGVSLSAAGGGDGSHVPQPPNPDVNLIVQRGPAWQSFALGPLTLGTRSLTARIDCAAGCTLRKIVFANPKDVPVTGRVTIAHLTTNLQPVSSFDRTLRTPTAWQNDLTLADPGLPVATEVGGVGDGLDLRFRDLVGRSQPAIAPADGPDPVPAVLARGTAANELSGFHHAVDGSSLDMQDVPFLVSARAVALPRSVGDGALVDLANLQRLSDPQQNQSVDEVWLAADTPTAVVSALRRNGLSVTGIERTSAARNLLRVAAPVRAVVANTAVVALLGLLAASALGAGIAIDASRRRQHLRVLRDAGLDPRSIRRYAARELTLPAGLAIIIGVGTAIISLLLAGSRLPLFATHAGPPLNDTLDWPVLVITAAAMLVLVVAAALGLAWGEYRAAINTRR